MSARRKGKDWEREVRDIFRALGWEHAERTPCSGGLASWPGDLMGVEPFAVECKADEHISVWSALAQARAAAERGSGIFPVVFLRRVRGRRAEVAVAMTVETFRYLARQLREGGGLA